MLKLLNIIILLNFVACTAITPLTTQQEEKKEEVPQKSVEINEELLVSSPKQTIPRDYQVFTKENTKTVKNYCDKMDLYFKKYNWGKSPCHEYTWHHVRNSYLGNPIVWYVFGQEAEESKKQKNTSLVMCGVHGDEITPVKFCFDFMEDLRHNPELLEENVVIVAPLVAPDSFFKPHPTRTNAKGVDVNRNFPTDDWAKDALRTWKNRYGSDKRRFPGKYALSEQETIFQVNLINLYKPNKVISIHAPLTLLDYDGPAFSQEEGMAARELLIQMSDKAGKYKISNYPFFPGSLGNWAGNERNIPTYTLELPNSDWNKTDHYYNMFRTALQHAIAHDLRVHMLQEKVSTKDSE